jgi:hypothetical protein
MPWHIGTDDSCPADKPVAVIKDDDGSVAGCHANEQDAKDQVAALYANEPMMEDALPVDDIEFRTSRLELRDVMTAGPQIDGYAAIYNSTSEEMGLFDRFRERITPGAFDGVLTGDTRALINHDPNYVLGRTKSGTLKLFADQKGLRSVITPPDTQWARDLMISMKRGDIDQMSFGFKIAKGGARYEMNDGVRLQIIDKVSDLFDVSVVTFPAYPASTVSARAYMESLARQSPAPQRSALVAHQPRVTAVSLARLNRRLNMAADFDLRQLKPRKERPNGNVD